MRRAEHARGRDIIKGTGPGQEERDQATTLLTLYASQQSPSLHPMGISRGHGWTLLISILGYFSYGS